MKPIELTQGNAVTIKATLYDENGAVVDLTGADVQFVFQGAGGSVSFSHAAAVDGDPTAGNVSYVLTADEAAVVGEYEVQWQVTKDSVVTIYPLPEAGSDQSGRIEFVILEKLPQLTPENIILVRQMYEPVRVTLGDLDASFRMYEDSAIAAVVRTCLASGKIPGQGLTPDRLGITPGITVPLQMGLLMNHAARTFLLPNLAEQRFETRALSQKRGKQDEFLWALDNAIYDAENGEMFASFQSFYAWVNALSGMDVWSLMTNMETRAPVASVTIGRAGVVVTTT